MRYFRRFYDNETREEITRKKAMSVVLGTYKNNRYTRAMLDTPNRIQCRFSEITVESDDGVALGPGKMNVLPDGMEWPEVFEDEPWKESDFA